MNGTTRDGVEREYCARVYRLTFTAARARILRHSERKLSVATGYNLPAVIKSPSEHLRYSNMIIFAALIAIFCAFALADDSVNGDLHLKDANGKIDTPFLLGQDLEVNYWQNKKLEFTPNAIIQGGILDDAQVQIFADDLSASQKVSNLIEISGSNLRIKVTGSEKVLMDKEFAGPLTLDSLRYQLRLTLKMQDPEPVQLTTPSPTSTTTTKPTTSTKETSLPTETISGPLTMVTNNGVVSFAGETVAIGGLPKVQQTGATVSVRSENEILVVSGDLIKTSPDCSLFTVEGSEVSVRKLARFQKAFVVKGLVEVPIKLESCTPIDTSSEGVPLSKLSVEEFTIHVLNCEELSSESSSDVSSETISSSTDVSSETSTTSTDVSSETITSSSVKTSETSTTSKKTKTEDESHKPKTSMKLPGTNINVPIPPPVGGVIPPVFVPNRCPPYCPGDDGKTTSQVTATDEEGHTITFIATTQTGEAEDSNPTLTWGTGWSNSSQKRSEPLQHDENHDDKKLEERAERVPRIFNLGSSPIHPIGYCHGDQVCETNLQRYFWNGPQNVPVFLDENKNRLPVFVVNEEGKAPGNACNTLRYLVNYAATDMGDEIGRFATDPSGNRYATFSLTREAERYLRKEIINQSYKCRRAYDELKIPLGDKQWDVDEFPFNAINADARPILTALLCVPGSENQSEGGKIGAFIQRKCPYMGYTPNYPSGDRPKPNLELGTNVRFVVLVNINNIDCSRFTVGR